MSKVIRPVGDIFTDMEKLLYELHIDHDMQHGEVIYGINGWQKIHVPSHIEPFDDGSKPMLHPMLGIMYGHESVFVEILKELKKKKKKVSKV